MFVDSDPSARRVSGPASAPDGASLSFANAWIASVDAGRRRTPGWAAALLAVMLVALAMYAGPALYRLLPQPGAAYPAVVLDRLAGDLCILAPLLIGAAVMVFIVERRPTPAASTPAGLAAGAGGLAGALAFLAAAGLVGALGGLQLAPVQPDGARRMLGLLVGAALVLVQAGAEEAFFRGWLQPVLAARWGPWVGLLSTAVLFAAAHAVLQPPGLVALLNDLLAGLAFGLIALRTGGLAAAIGAHWGWNWAEQNLMGLTPNPGVDPLGALFDFDLRGPRLLSGGADEMNGSLCATVALVLLIAAAGLYRPRAAR